MSDNISLEIQDEIIKRLIPLEIQEEIIKRLPVRSLIQFRSVSKTWKSLIGSSNFIARYSAQNTLPQHLLVRYLDSSDNLKYVSIVVDDSFPKHKVDVTNPHVERLRVRGTIGSSHGLLCLYGDYREGRDGPNSGTGRVIIWNPSIRKAVVVVVPNVGDGTAFGFGVCRETLDPKIVKITHIENIAWQVEVFTLSTKAWRSPCSNLFRESIRFGIFQVVIGGLLYWLARDCVTMDGGFRYYNLVITFDMTTEEIREVNLPNWLAHELNDYNLSMSKLRESLVVIDETNESAHGVWLMEDGAFTKLYTINTFTLSVKGFTKSGEPTHEVSEDYFEIYKLVSQSYYPSRINYFEIDGIVPTYSVYPYMETLLLRDQPNLIIS